MYVQTGKTGIAWKEGRVLFNNALNTMLDQVYHDNIQKAIIEKKYMFKVKKKEKKLA